MKIINANKLTENFELKTNICILGAGAAGITIARELNNCPYQVLLLESGGFGPDCEIQSLYKIENIGKPLRHELKRVRYFGGTTNIWTGQCVMLNTIDFKEREWVKNSGWLIQQEELLPYYEGAVNVLKLPSYKHFSFDFWQEKLTEKPEFFFVSQIKI